MFNNIPVITPVIITILLFIYHVLILLHIPYPLGFGIILLTILIRLILYPFVSQQLKTSTKMQHIAPHVARLKEVHKGDAKRLQSETMKLYKEHGVNPAAGCLPLLVQLPIIWGLYGVLNVYVKLAPQKALPEINHLVLVKSLALSKPWDTGFFGLPLGQSPSQMLSHVGFLIVLVPLATAFFQFIQSKMMMPKKIEGQTEKKSDDFATAFQTQSMYIFPLMIGFFSFQFPIGLSLYWNTFTIFGILQQYQIQRSTPMPVIATVDNPKPTPGKKKKRQL